MSELTTKWQERWLDTRDLAEVLRWKVSPIETRRCRGEDLPPHHKWNGRCVRYWGPEVVMWCDQRRVKPAPASSTGA